MTSPWPFYMWGVEILGPFSLTLEQVKFLLVVVDYFTKWVEVELVATISVERVKRFYWKTIICRFGLPIIIMRLSNPSLRSSILIAMGKQRQQTELYLKDCISDLKRRKRSCYRCFGHIIPHSTTQETPFCLTFGMDAMIPVEEEREMAHIREYAVKARVTRRYKSTCSLALFKRMT
ncbi:hypothetical protein CR513_36806, partial [Mucuna pruriens]